MYHLMFNSVLQFFLPIIRVMIFCRNYHFPGGISHLSCGAGHPLTDPDRRRTNKPVKVFEVELVKEGSDLFDVERGRIIIL